MPQTLTSSLRRRERGRIGLADGNHAMHRLIRLQIDVAVDDIRIKPRQASRCPAPWTWPPARSASPANPSTSMGVPPATITAYTSVPPCSLALEAGALEHPDFHALPTELCGRSRRAGRAASLSGAPVYWRTELRARRGASINFLNAEFKHCKPLAVSKGANALKFIRVYFITSGA